MDDGKKERKRHDLVLEKLQTRDQWNDNGLISSIKVFVERIKQEHTSTMLMKQKLITRKYWPNE